MKKTLEKAKEFLGTKEGDAKHREILSVYNAHKPLARNYKMKVTDAWCATFISYLFIATGLADLIGTECGCERQIQLLKKKGIWIENDGYVPVEGDLIYYDFQDTGVGDNLGWSDHVGIVESCDGKVIYTIEGNVSDSVARRKIAVNGKNIRGFAHPNYPAGNTQPPKPPKPTETVKDIIVIAREVIAGKWGNGANRKTRLEAAGYNYKTVQAKVNELLKTPSAPEKPIYYKVVKYDNLSKIGKKYKVTVEQLVQWNKIVNPNVIRIGQVLRVG